MRAEAALRGQVEHLRTERGEQTTSRGTGLRQVQAVEELAHRLQRARVLGRRLGVADPIPSRKRSAERGAQLGVAGGDVLGLVVQTLTIPVATVSVEVSSRNGRTSESDGLVPTQIAE